MIRWFVKHHGVITWIVIEHVGIIICALSIPILIIEFEYE